MSDEIKPSLETLAVHGGQQIDSKTGSRAVPIYQTASYGFKDSKLTATSDWLEVERSTGEVSSMLFDK